MSYQLNHHRSAFTNLEMMVTIGIIGIIAVLVLVAVNPLKHLTDARNAVCQLHAGELSGAMQQFVHDRDTDPGNIAIPTDEAAAIPICKFGVTDGAYCVNLDQLVTYDYIQTIPVEPRSIYPDYTGFYAYKYGVTLMGKCCYGNDVDIACPGVDPHTITASSQSSASRSSASSVSSLSSASAASQSSGISSYGIGSHSSDSSLSHAFGYGYGNSSEGCGACDLVDACKCMWQVQGGAWTYANDSCGNFGVCVVQPTTPPGTAGECTCEQKSCDYGYGPCQQ